MPKERFLHLPEEKRKRICRAAYDELSEVTYDELSINRIIQRAGIPRGSFYQYFDGKEDLLTYMLEGSRKCLLESVKEIMKKSGGDIFFVYLEVLKQMVAIGGQEEHYRVLKHIFSGLHVAEMKPFEIYQEINEEFVREIYPLADLSRFRSDKQEDFVELTELLCVLTRQAGIEIFSDITRKEAILRKVELWLEIVKNGVLKKEEQEVNVEV